MVHSRVAAIRHFNRFYTRTIGVLQEGLLGGPFSLTETRVLFELAHNDRLTAAMLARELGLDTGYLSRILARFEAAGLIARQVDTEDARKIGLRLMPKGRVALAPLEARADAQIAAVLAGIPEDAARDAVGAMRRIETVLSGRTKRPWLLRGLQPGDLGWVVSRHGSMYYQEYGWDSTFETLVAEIAAGVMQAFDPSREAAWIAELDGVAVGSVFLVRQSDEVAKLRLLIVDPAARGLGIGARLVAECTRFARQAGYRRITLWTHSILTAARRLYAAEGYILTGSDTLEAFGVSLTEETWDLDLPVHPVRQ